MVLSWNGVLGTMSGTEKGFARRFLFTVIRKTEMLESGETMDYLWKSVIVERKPNANWNQRRTGL